MEALNCVSYPQASWGIQPPRYSTPPTDAISCRSACTGNQTIAMAVLDLRPLKICHSESAACIYAGNAKEDKVAHPRHDFSLLDRKPWVLLFNWRFIRPLFAMQFLQSLKSSHPGLSPAAPSNLATSITPYSAPKVCGIKMLYNCITIKREAL